MERRPSKKGIALTDRSTLQDRVLETIRQSIFQGVFAPNEHLIQEDLANLLGVSRMPVREALHQLEKEGLVINIPHKGSVVAPMTIDDIDEIYTMREKLERLAAENSFPKLNSNHLQQLDIILNKMDIACENNEKHFFSELNWEFHHLLLQENNWKRLNNVIGDLWNGFTPYSPSITGKMAKSLQEHIAIVESIKNNNLEEAIEVYVSHIQSAKERLIDYVKKEPSFLNKGFRTMK